MCIRDSRSGCPQVSRIFCGCRPLHSLGLRTRPIVYPAAMLAKPAIFQCIEGQFPGRVLRSLPADKHGRIELEAEHWREFATFLLNDERLQFDWLRCLT